MHPEAFDSLGKTGCSPDAGAPKHQIEPESYRVYFLYSFLLGLAALLTSPYWLIQGLRHGKYLSNLSHRLGFSISELEKLPSNRPGAIWIHAVSVGEALSSFPLPSG